MQNRQLNKSTARLYQSLGVAVRNNADVLSNLFFIVAMSVMFERAFGSITPLQTAYFTGEGTGYKLDVYSPDSPFTNLVKLLENGSCGVTVNLTLVPADFIMAKQWLNDLVILWRGLDQNAQAAIEQCVGTLVENAIKQWEWQQNLVVIIVLSSIFGAIASPFIVVGCAACICAPLIRGIRNSYEQAREHYRLNHTPDAQAETAAQTPSGQTPPGVAIELNLQPTIAETSEAGLLQNDVNKSLTTTP